MPLKLLHVADVHLDAPFGWLGRKGPDQRRQLTATFRSAVDLAIRESVDAVLIAGDLFDSNSPTQASVDLVRAELRRLDRPTFILPGTHDCLDSGSIYRRVAFDEIPQVRVFDAERAVFEVAPLGLAVHARANEAKTSEASPLRGLAPLPTARYNVALAHGSLAMPGTADDYPLSAAEIAASGFDYVALGHWHRCQNCSAGRTVAWYSGPLEMLKIGDAGSALGVEIAGRGAGDVRITRHDLGQTKHRQLTVEVDATTTTETLRAAIAAHRDPALVLAVRLVGLRPLGLHLDTDALVAELRDDFRLLRIDDDSHPALSPADLAAFPERTVLGEYVRRLSERIDASADDAERRRAEAALQLGVSLLLGREVL